MKKIENIVKRNAEKGNVKTVTLSGTSDEIVHQTMMKMRELAIRDANSPMIAEIAKSIKSCCDYKMAKSAFDIVVSMIKYVPDPDGMEYVRAPIHCLQEKKGDCDDMSCLYASIMHSLDIPVMFKAIAWRRHEFTHVYCLVYCDKIKKWIVADPVIKTFGKEKQGIIRDKLVRV